MTELTSYFGGKSATEKLHNTNYLEVIMGAPLIGDIAEGSKVLWVASTGGHLSQLERIAAQSNASDDSTWVTFDSPQSRGLLENKNVCIVPYVRPRQGFGAVRAAITVAKQLDIGSYDLCVSTGSTIAATLLPLAAARGTRAIYLESVSRTDGPSLTGRILQRVPKVETKTQHSAWSSSKWPYAGSVLDTWQSNDVRNAVQPRKIFVTLGTIKPYRFDRLVDAVLGLLKPGDVVSWQLGVTGRTDVAGENFFETTTGEMARLAAEADVVISHAGVGSILSFLDNGIFPVLAVRKKQFGEHVDNHQEQIAREMCSRGLALELDLQNPKNTVLDQASRRGITEKTAE